MTVGSEGFPELGARTSPDRYINIFVTVDEDSDRYFFFVTVCRAGVDLSIFRQNLLSAHIFACQVLTFPRLHQQEQ